MSLEKLRSITGKSINEITEKYCSQCNSKIKETTKEKTPFLCPKCNSLIEAHEKKEFIQCKKCGFIQKLQNNKKTCFCGSNNFYLKFNPLAILELDIILISSRHLYRCVYSLHEKSGLVSIPVDPDKILDFSKEDAKPENVSVSSFKFLDIKKVIKNETKELLDNVFFWKLLEEKKQELKPKREYEELATALDESFFPPCIKKGLNGLEDGKKRFLFILTNFLSSVGWDYEKIEKKIREWNKKNPDPMRETYFIGQLRYHKQHKKKVLPPNCFNKMYYKDMGICFPDNLCEKIKNPVNYAKRKARYYKPDKKKKE